MILTAVCAFCGWIAETVLFWFKRGEFVDRGLLILPFCPVYGLSMLTAYAIMRTPQSGLWKKWQNSAKTVLGKITVIILCIALYAIIAAVFASVIEYLAGLYFDKRFGIRLWSYRGYENNVGGYVCLWYSLLWGALAVAYMGLIWYPLMQLLAKADTAALAAIAFTLIMLMLADFVYNMLYLFIKGARYAPFK